MKKHILTMTLLLGTLCMSANRWTTTHDLTGRTGDIIIGNNTKQFVVYNYVPAPYQLRLRMAFRRPCRSEVFLNVSQPRFIIEKRWDCVPVRLSGYLFDPADRVEIQLVEWPQGSLSTFGDHIAAYGAVWEIKMNEDGKTATVHFRRGLHTFNAPVD